MSEITSPTEPRESSELPDGGLDIRGFEEQENQLEGTEESDSISGGNLSDVLSSLSGDDTLEGLDNNDTIFGGEGNDVLRGDTGNDSLVGNADSDTLEGGTGDDVLIAGNTDDVLDGGAGRDLLIASGSNNVLSGGADADRFEINIARVTATTLDRITDYEAGEQIVIKGNGRTGKLAYNSETGRLSRNGEDIAQLSSGLNIDLGDVEFLGTVGLDRFLNDPTAFMDQIQDFDGNNFEAVESWKSIGETDIQGDGDNEQILINPELQRWSTVGANENNRIDFSDNGEDGDTRVVGIYIDPLVEAGEVERFSPLDSQQRFQNDLKIDNLALLENSDDDFDGDGFQDVYFRVKDGSAVLRASMEADGNIRYANYQSAEQLEQFMTENGIDNQIWEEWI
jgi:hypothetical protein